MLTGPTNRSILAPTSLSDVIDVSAASGRLAAVNEAIVRASRLANRTDVVELVAISKTWGVDDIRTLIRAGQRAFGENRVAEAEAKWPGLRAETPGIRLHLVGQLQSNKAAEAVALFDVIHSVDRMSLVMVLGKTMKLQGKFPGCYIQVNIGGEAQKGGCPIAETPALITAAQAAGLPIIGLMCVPPAGIEAAPFFALLAKMARDQGLTCLSMGMSGDFETAVMLGATTVRVGSALFGDRAP